MVDSAVTASHNVVGFPFAKPARNFFQRPSTRPQINSRVVFRAVLAPIIMQTRRHRIRADREHVVRVLNIGQKSRIAAAQLTPAAIPLVHHAPRHVPVERRVVFIHARR